MAGRLVARPTSLEERQRIFGKRGWFKSLPSEFQLGLLPLCDEHRFETGDSIFEAGDCGGGIYGVVSGSISCWISSPYCALVMAHVLRESSWFGEGPATTGENRTMSFRALEPSVVLQLPLLSIRLLAQRDPDTHRYLAALAAGSALIAIRSLSDLLVPQAERRLASVLLRVSGAEVEIAEATGEGVRLSQREIGEMTGFSRNHVGRILLALQARGLIRLGHSRIAIIDTAAMIAFASGQNAPQREASLV